MMLVAATALHCGDVAQWSDAAGPDGAMDQGRSDVTDTSVPVCTGKVGASGDFDLHMTFGSADRRYLMHVPTSYAGESAVPVVMVFHGFGERPEDSRAITHFDAVGDARNWITVFPAGLFASWNGGGCCGPSQLTHVDDVGFVRALAARIARDYCVDSNRVFATGFSNGGFFAHRLGCEAADVIAAIGVGSGQMTMPACAPSRPIAVIQVHGTSDPLVPFDGNPILMYPATRTTISGWATRNGCTAEPTEVYRDGTAHCTVNGGCRAGADVELCSVDGGGHDWFGGGALWTDAGPPAGFVETNAIADFFAAHPMP